VSICGYAPIMTLMEYSKLITKNPKSKILRQGHSGEVYPSNEVVDYVSILFYKE
jgi:AmmeMemoRadiSam system protein B